VSVTLAFVALGCGTNFGGLGTLVSVVSFKILVLCHPYVKGFVYYTYWGGDMGTI